MSSLNIAERCKLHYESKDFRQDYINVLFESYCNDSSTITKKIIDLFNISNYETQKELSNWFVIDKSQAEKIYKLIEDNFESFVSNFSGYWVGYTSLDSVAYSEQEEQLTGIYNHKTKMSYSLKYLRKTFRDAGYCINKSNPDYAYYIVGGGIHIDLLQDKELLNNFLLTIK